MQDTSSGAASSTAPAEGGPAGGNDAGEDGGHSDHASPCTPPDEVAREGTEKLGTKFPPSPFLDVQKLQRRRGWTINILLFDFTFPFKRFSTTSAEKRVEQKDIPFRFGRGGVGGGVRRGVRLQSWAHNRKPFCLLSPGYLRRGCLARAGGRPAGSGALCPPAALGRGTTVCWIAVAARYEKSPCAHYCLSKAVY